jgi:hypothetical protein
MHNEHYTACPPPPIATRMNWNLPSFLGKYEKYEMHYMVSVAILDPFTGEILLDQKV